MADEKLSADEILSDDELDNVVGGTYEECTNDLNWLANRYGLKTDDFAGGDDPEKLAGLFDEVSIHFALSDYGANEYLFRIPSRGIFEYLSRDEAFKRLTDHLDKKYAKG